MNQISLPLAQQAANRPVTRVPALPGPQGTESLFVVRIPLLANDEAALCIQAALPGASIVGVLRAADTICDNETERKVACKDARDALTDRQRDVLSLLVDGLSNKEIGRRPQLSHFTVRNHVSSILRILNFRCRRDMRATLCNVGSLPRDGSSAQHSAAFRPLHSAT